jgi:hypothetical protein
VLIREIDGIWRVGVPTGGILVVIGVSADGLGLSV